MNKFLTVLAFGSIVSATAGAVDLGFGVFNEPIGTTDIYTPNYTCAGLQRTMLAVKRAVAIQTPSGFSWYAIDSSYCGGGSPSRASVWGTKDGGSCDVGYACNYPVSGGDGQ